MGLFKNFEYTVVAKNVAAIYFIIENSDFGQTLTSDQKLFATALLDTSSYLANGQVAFDEVKQCHTYAGIGYVCVGGMYRISHGSMLCRPEETVVNLAMQISALLFTSSKRGYQYLKPNWRKELKSIVKNKSLFSSIVLSTLKEGYDNKTVEELYPFVMKMLSEDAFKATIYAELEDENDNADENEKNAEEGPTIKNFAQKLLSNNHSSFSHYHLESDLMTIELAIREKNYVYACDIAQIAAESILDESEDFDFESLPETNKEEKSKRIMNEIFDFFTYDYKS